MNYLQQISPCTVQSGSIKNLKVIEARHFSRFDLAHFNPHPAGLPPYTMQPQDLALTPDAHCFEWLMGRRTAQHTETHAQDPHTDYYTHALGFYLPLVAPTITDWLQHHRNKDWVVIYQDTSRQVRIVGTPDQPLKLSTTTTTNPRRQDGQRTSLSFTGTTTNPTPYLMAYNNAILFPTTPITTIPLTYDHL